MNEQKNINTSIEDQVLIITIDRPRGNFINPKVIAELDNAVETFLKDPSSNIAIIASSNQSVFSFGADIAAYSKSRIDQKASD